MPVLESALLDALKSVVDPNTGKDFVTTRQLKNLRIEDGDVAFDAELGYPAKSQIAGLRKALIAAARTVAGVQNVSVNLASKVTPHAVQRGVQLLPKVKNIVAVARLTLTFCTPATVRAAAISALRRPAIWLLAG